MIEFSNDHVVQHHAILSAIASMCPFSAMELNTAFLKTRSYDNLILTIEVARAEGFDLTTAIAVLEGTIR